MASTPIQGSDNFPTTENEFYTAVETLAVQNIREIKNTNRIEDGFFEYPVDGNGNIIEEAVIEMAAAKNFVNTGAPDLSPVDPKLHVKYFNNFVPKQFEASTRKDDIRKILSGVSKDSVESVSAKILSTLTEGEGNYDYEQMRDVLKDASVGKDAGKILWGGTEAAAVHPLNMEGVIYALRDMYNAVKATNTIGTGLTDVKQSCPTEDIRVAVSEDLLNMIDVTTLANIFNLSKQELFGKLVVIPKDSAWTAGRVMVYDRKAFGRGTRVYDYTQDFIGKGRYMNSYLTSERAYFYNPLFKCFYLDCSVAETAKLATLIGA